MLKTVSSVANAIGALNYKGTWNADTNTPTLASGVGTQGDYYVVSVSGATDLDGITNWGVGDWATFNGSVWQRVEGGSDGNFVNLQVTGTSTLKAILGDSLGLGGSSPDRQITILKDSISADVNYVKMSMDSWGGSAGKLKSIVWDDAGSSVAGIGAEYDGAKTNIHFHSQYNGGFKGTADRTLSVMGNGNVTLPVGNLVIGTSGQGIDFSATAGTGTSELLDDYEEGDWTPVDASGAGLTFVNDGAHYVKVGSLVTATFAIIYPSTADASAASVGGLPFTSQNTYAAQYPAVTSLTTYGTPFTALVQTAATNIVFFTYGLTALTNTNLSSQYLRCTAIYRSA